MNTGADILAMLRSIATNVEAIVDAVSYRQPATEIIADGMAEFYSCQDCGFKVPGTEPEALQWLVDNRMLMRLATA